MKRFWDQAAVADEPDGYRVLLDGKPVRLPSGEPLQVAAAPLAAAIATEWATAGGQKGGDMSPADIPLTRLAGTAQDRIARDPAAMVEGLAKYAGTDLLCYRAEDRRLAAIEALEWQPLLDWAAREHAAPLRVTTGLMPIAQDPDALAALHRVVAGLTPIELAALGVLVPGLGSLVLGLAVVQRYIDAPEAHRLATVDERWQEEFWGTDPASESRRARFAEEAAVAERMLALAAPA